MTPAIASGSTASTAITARPDLERVDANASARPQVQSRRVSLKLGPFGISYSTDRVLWTEAVAAAAAQALGASEAKGVAATQGSVASATRPDEAGQDGVDGRQAQAQQAEATSRAFSLELAQASRRQVEEKVRSDRTYGRNGAVKTNAAAGKRAAEPAQQATASASEPSSAATGLFAARQDSAAPSRMRRAIDAYLACAGDFGAAPPMLNAVA